MESSIIFNEENLRKAYYDDELTQQECADLFGYSKRTIQEYFRKWGLKGRTERNEKWKSRISTSMEGNTNGEGVVFTEERKKKISERSSAAIRKKIAEEGFHWGHTGYKHSEDTINNLREGQIKKLQDKFYLGKMTKLEKKGYAKLDEAGFEYEPQKQIDYYLVDAYIPEYNTIVEFQGQYWHSRDDIKYKDEAKRKFFKQKGYKLVEVWEQDIDTWNPESIME